MRIVIYNDQFNRLVCSNLASNGTCASPTNGAPTYNYVYDRFGNRWQQNGPYTFAATFTGNATSNNNRVDLYSYDTAGNLLDDGTHQYFYDAENRLIQVDGTAGYCTTLTGTAATACYGYNAEGQRVHRTGVLTDNCDGTGKRDYAYDLSGNWVLEASSSGSACTSQIYAGGRHLTTYYDGNVFFEHTDWLGTVRRENTTANPTSSYHNCSSLPFGDGLQCTWYNNTLHFTGKERDQETGLDNFGARFNASNFGRFMSPDPTFESSLRASPQTWNRYSYALNRPLDIIDPDGELWQQNLSGTWDWMDKCNAGATCVTQIAEQQGNSVVAYGPSSAKDKKIFQANKTGYVNVADIAATDGAYFEFQSGVTATYASLQTAVDLYNGAFDYHVEYPDDAKLSLNDIGIATGAGFSPHKTHNLGRAFDASYMGQDGKPIHRGNLGVWLADADRMKALVRIFEENGFNQNYSDNDIELGVSYAPGHINHIHFGKSLHIGRCEIGPCR